jgi:hypothetical protein
LYIVFGKQKAATTTTRRVATEAAAVGFSKTAIDIIHFYFQLRVNFFYMHMALDNKVGSEKTYTITTKYR